eukprot:GHVQ01042737.1.p1 GENE.GHVQ01042737.1~~GHVQ01042737.1.p1  ORF type:complete len:327 (+),score=67.36 GHVQ01042737.1:366-1346(+)
MSSILVQSLKTRSIAYCLRLASHTHTHHVWTLNRQARHTFEQQSSFIVNSWMCQGRDTNSIRQKTNRNYCSTVQHYNNLSNNNLSSHSTTSNNKNDNNNFKTRNNSKHCFDNNNDVFRTHLNSSLPLTQPHREQHRHTTLSAPFTPAAILRLPSAITFHPNDPSPHHIPHLPFTRSFQYFPITSKLTVGMSTYATSSHSHGTRSRGEQEQQVPEKEAGGGDELAGGGSVGSEGEGDGVGERSGEAGRGGCDTRGSVYRRIEEKLQTIFSPTELDIIDESHLHRGHVAMRGVSNSAETHFRFAGHMLHMYIFFFCLCESLLTCLLFM